MTDGGPRDPLDALGRRIEDARRATGAESGARRGETQSSFGAALAFAWRVGLELVAAIVVGTGLGWALDRWLGTRPWGMIVLFFLGVAAGMVNVWRAVTGSGAAVGFRQPNDTSSTRDKGKDED